MPIPTVFQKTWLITARRVWNYAFWGVDPTPIVNTPVCLNSGTFPGEFLTGMNAAGNGSVNMIGVDGSNRVVLPNGAITPSGSIGLSVTVPLTAAQIITLNTVPVPLVAAPGVGFALIVDSLIFEMTTTATQFTGGGAVAPVYHGSTTPITGNTIPATVVTAVAGTSNTFLSAGAIANGLTMQANTGVDLFAATANFAVGTGTAKIIVNYKVITL